MGKYYYLVAGLPTIAFEGGKPPYTVSLFKDELVNNLTKADLRLLDLLFLKVDNKNLLKRLQNPEHELIPGGKFSIEELEAVITGLKKEIDSKKIRKEQKEERDKVEFLIDPPPLPSLFIFKNKNRRLPGYFVRFTKLYLESAGNEEKTTIPWEDRLASMYYEYAMKCSNVFVSSWFELNLNINNIFTALTCRKYKLERANYIVGDTAVSQKLRSSNARDFETGDSLVYFPSVLRIAEETDLMQREMKTDLLKWDWLNEQMFVKVFEIDNVLTYMLKIEMLERWANLDKVTGDQTFRQLVGVMKKGSVNALEEFKRNNKK